MSVMTEPMAASAAETTGQARPTPPSAPLLVEILLLALAYAVVGLLSRPPSFLGDLGQFASPIWPAAGVALGALLVRGRRLWPGVWLGCLVVTAVTLAKTHAPASSLAGAAAISGGATLEALLGLALVRRFVGDHLALDTVSNVLRFFAGCAVLPTLAGATIGVAVLSMLGDGMVTETLLINGLSWWAGDAIGVMMASPIVLALAWRRRPVWKTRPVRFSVPLLFGIVVLSLSLFFVDRLERTNRQAEFQRAAELAHDALRMTFSQTEEVSAFLLDFYRTARQVNRREFDVLARGIHERHPAIQALEWIPRVTRPELAAHEEATRAEGLPGYAVLEKTRDGRRVPVAARGEYFPVHFVYPMAGNEKALGYDLGSEAMRRQAIVDAVRSRRTVASAPIRLIQEKEDQYGVLVFAPFFPGDGEGRSLQGLALTVIRVGQLAESALANLPAGMDYRLEDLSAPQGGRLLAESARQLQGAPYGQDYPFDFGGRPWRLSIFAGDDYRFAHFAWYTWATLACALLLSGAGTLFLLVMSGRTARTEQLVAERTAELEAARAEAVKSGQLLREAVASIAQGFTIYDAEDRLVVCNDAYRRIYAGSADLILPGTTFEKIVRGGAERGQYPEAVCNVDAWVAARVAQHRNGSGEAFEQQLSNGRWLLVTEYRTPSGFIVGNRIDITELKRTAAELGERNAQLDAIFRLTPDGLVSFDHAGEVKSVNPAFQRMTGLTEAEVLGRPQSELEARLREHAEAHEQWPGLEPCFAKADPLGTAPERRGRMLLSLRWPHTAVLELLGVSGGAAVVGRLLYLHDVTHEVEVERMKSEFLSHAAHELRTPMAAIFGFTELLLTGHFDDATRADLLQTIHRQTSWLIEIINELLDLSRIESRRGKDLRVEAVSVAPVVEEVVANLQIDPVRWPVTRDLPADLPPVKADLAKLRQVLINVVGNAVKYSPKGGGITISATEIEGRRGERQVAITVSDQGIGMTSAQAARVCERFYRADTSGSTPGTGLGMAIVKEIMELLGGRVEIASTHGVGTVVTLRLTCALNDPGESALSPAPAGPEAPG